MSDSSKAFHLSTAIFPPSEQPHRARFYLRLQPSNSGPYSKRIYLNSVPSSSIAYPISSLFWRLENFNRNHLLPIASSILINDSTPTIWSKLPTQQHTGQMHRPNSPVHSPRSWERPLSNQPPAECRLRPSWGPWTLTIRRSISAVCSFERNSHSSSYWLN